MTVVVFRKFRDGDVFALFPELPGTNDSGTCLSYAHLGQHGAADINVIYRSLPASPQEYEPLHGELCGLGYTLTVRHKITRAHDAARRAALDEIK